MNPSKNIRRYSSLALAQLAADNQLKPTIILLGDGCAFLGSLHATRCVDFDGDGL